MSQKVGKIEIVIKGGQPWGFRLQAKAENRSVVIVDEIVRGGRADQQGELKVGDHVIKINGIQCLSLADALQLIDSAFRTLTIVVWRTNNFLSKDKPKDYFDAVHQFDQMPNNAPYESQSTPQSTSIYENINFTFQEGKQRSRKFSPIEKFCHVNNKDILTTNSQHLPSNTSKVYPAKNDYYKNNFKTPYSCVDKTFKIEPENKAAYVYNPERKHHSKTQKDLHLYSNVQPLPALNYMPEINKYERRHFSRTPKETRQYSNVHYFNNSTYGKIFNISESPDTTPVPSIPIQGNNMPTANHNLGQYPINNTPTNNTKVSTEYDCCRYPNCHNKYFNCKIHSPPERDVTYPARQSFKNDYENIDFISQPNFTYKDQNNCDNLNYEQNIEEPILNSVPFGNEKKELDYKTLKWKNDSVPSNSCDFPVIKSSNNPSNYKLEESLNYIVPKTTSDTPTNSVGENSVSPLCHFSNSAYETKVNSSVKADDLTCQSLKDSNIFHDKTVYGQINHVSYNVQGKESTSKCLYSSWSKPSFSKRMFSSMNNASFIKENDMFFGASNNSMCMISKEAAVVKLVSSRPQQIYVDEDDELKEIDANRNRIAASFSPINASPPLPSPPPENDTEILPYHEPLPSPPLFVSEQKQNNGSERVETIYANLEMLKIQYSVVSSTSQTNTSNEKHSVKYSSSVEDIASNISSEESTSHSVQSEFVEAKPQVDDPFMEKIFQNQEKNLRMLNLPFNSAYFTTSVPKAKLLTRYTSKLHPNKMTEVKELSNEKEELIASLRKKLNILLEEEAALQDELRQNEELGNNLSDKLDGTATQNELKKFRNHVQELEKITNLLLSLSGRLARTKNALLILPSDASAEEKVLLDTKYKKLTQQYEEALHLQKDIDNRNKQVLVYLQKYLNKDELADYNHFIKMKVKLLVDYKELVEKIKLGEEQLKALTNS
ncbi:uncharacterized protein LOC129971581 [Argiope bruennichi]|uniref:uncharacterized protein LOC129971581 n=1 Tax=Argiope bruennichi TaxID=94029 RepID=UPI0024957379|nr:uncharacterized protein LOC129971581 [Argiope bruennichi]